MKIIKLISVPQPNDPRYYWIYGLGDDNQMYTWHEWHGRWELMKKYAKNKNPELGD